ncbi:MAG TPA: diaminopimelate decarboxylase [Candidatus Dormibacteraeota bacterium]|nr:diaminopimelate decarboxylase [Candidatus Dormibacteraeota bacterium]
MPLPDTAERDAAGRLRVGGCDLAELAGRHGTPLYVFDEETIRARLRAYRHGLDTWAPGGDVLYSAKAYFGLAMARLVVEEGVGVDVVSGGELELALRAGVPAARIAFAGSNKSRAEVEQAAEAGIGHLVVDSALELGMAMEVGAPRPIRVLLRVSPGIDPHTHRFISTGQLDSKFGFPVEDGTALRVLGDALSSDGLDVAGVHAHIGSQITDLGGYTRAIERVFDLLAAARRDHGFEARALSVGGGLAIAHTRADEAPTVDALMSTVTSAVAAACDKNAMPQPILLVEPGRSVVGNAGVAVYTVGARKQIPGVRTYVSVDGGMADNLRPMLYGARYEPVPVVESAGAAHEVVTVAGRYCESSDVLVESASLPRLEPGDLLALPAAGAYTLSMSSNYNGAPRPAVVFVRDGTARLVRRRETLDDWLGPELA